MLLYMAAQTIWMMTFTQIMAIWTPGISMQDPLNTHSPYMDKYAVISGYATDYWESRI